MDGQTLLQSEIAVLGIDPGLSGAVARLGQGALTVRRDFKKLGDIPRAVLDLSQGCSRGVMEFVGAMPGQGVCSMFSFGKAAGAAEASLSLAFPNDPVIEVAPVKWQNFFRTLLGIDKRTPFNSRAICQYQLFPDYAALFEREKDHNTADAVLIAAWGILNPGAVTSRGLKKRKTRT